MFQRRTWALALLLVGLLPAGLAAQLPVFVSGTAGGAFNTDENTPGGTSGGFAYQTQLGLRLAHVAFGGEYASYSTGADVTSRVFGGFVRFPSYLGDSPTQIYLALGLGVYRFSPSAGKGSTTAGGSLGPGVSIGLRNVPVAFVAEVRFHSTFDKLPRINNQQYIAVLGGAELRF
jgi:hypothetical protein